MIGSVSATGLAVTASVVAVFFILIFVLWLRIRSIKGTNALRFSRSVQIDNELPAAMSIVANAMKSMGSAIEYFDENEAAVTALFGGQFYLDSTFQSLTATRTDIHLRAWNAFDGTQGLGWDLGQSKHLVQRLVDEIGKLQPVDTIDPGHYGDNGPPA